MEINKIIHYRYSIIHHARDFILILIMSLLKKMVLEIDTMSFFTQFGLGPFFIVFKDTFFYADTYTYKKDQNLIWI